MRDILIPSNCARGRVRAYRVRSMPYVGMQLSDGRVMPGRWNNMTPWQDNDVLYDWASIVSRLLAEGNAQYRIAGMYLEYKNVGAPASIPAPGFDRSGGISYYNNLAGSPSVDYLRVPLVAATRSSSDVDTFPDGNVMTFFAMSQGTTGVHGKAFSHTAISEVYGGALVAIPDLADRTKDLVFSRFYFSSANQQVKLATSQIGLEWQVTLE